MNHDKILELQRYLNENLSKDFIWVSHFQMIIFVFFIKKLKEELYFCMNYWDLNANHSQELIFSVSDLKNAESFKSS